MKKIRLIIITIISFVLGGIIAILVLYPQIQNRYKIGHNAGRLDGGFEVINFLEENVQNNTAKEKVDLEKYLDFKDARISIVEIDGIKTIIIE